jgi:hypothetical protein
MNSLLNKTVVNGQVMVYRAMNWYTVVRETENAYVLVSASGEPEYCVGEKSGSLSSMRPEFVATAQAAANSETDAEFDRAILNFPNV